MKRASVGPVRANDAAGIAGRSRHEEPPGIRVVTGRSGTIRGYVGGTFDLFHAGHVAFFKQCRAKCDHLIVSLNTDEFAARYKRPPVLTFDDRVQVISACRYVDEVVTNVGDEDSRVAIAASSANIVFHGDDWVGPSLMKQMRLTDDFLRERGITLQYVPYTRGISTSDIIGRVLGLYGDGAAIPDHRSRQAAA